MIETEGAREARRLADAELYVLIRLIEIEGARAARRMADAEQHVKTRELETLAARDARRLANAKQHAQFCMLETVEQQEERCLENTARNIERQARIAHEDGIQAVGPVGLQDICAPLANPNVQKEILGRISQECTFCGAFFWVEERTGGSTWRPQYSKCCFEGKVFTPRVRTPPKYMRMLQDPQKKELRTKLRFYNLAFAFTSTQV
ncbi:unnamed protein product [Sphagnum balticum]